MMLNQTVAGSQEEIVAERFPDGRLSTRSVPAALTHIISTFPSKASRKASVQKLRDRLLNLKTWRKLRGYRQAPSARSGTPRLLSSGASIMPCR